MFSVKLGEGACFVNQGLTHTTWPMLEAFSKRPTGNVWSSVLSVIDLAITLLGACVFLTLFDHFNLDRNKRLNLDQNKWFVFQVHAPMHQKFHS